MSTFFGAKTHSEDLKLPLEKKQTLMTMHDLAALLLQIASENEDTPANYERMISRELERSCQLRDTQYDPTNKKQELRRICQELPANFDKTTLYGRMALDCLAKQTEKYKNEDQCVNETTVQVKPLEPIPSMPKQGG
ncbi:MAG: hypothetical protein KAS93_02025 [Gammaproteobacteria bacterium]|nr:hypothetical protein [Gammaproteobacteria bacterium]